MHAKIDPKLQKISKIQVLRIIINEILQVKYSRGFCRVSEKLHWFYFDQVNSKNNWMELEMNVREMKIKGIEDHNTLTDSVQDRYEEQEL